MARKTSELPPQAQGLLQRFGERLHLLRVRRRLSAKHMAAAAGMSVMTLRSLERGGDGVTMGAYLAVMGVLGIERDLEELAAAAFLAGGDDPGHGRSALEATHRQLRDEVTDAESLGAPLPNQPDDGADPVVLAETAGRVGDASGWAVASEGSLADSDSGFEWLDAPARDLQILLGLGDAAERTGGTPHQGAGRDDAKAEAEARAVETIPDLFDAASSGPDVPPDGDPDARAVG